MHNIRSIFESYDNKQLINVIEHQKDYSPHAVDVCSSLLVSREVNRREIREIAIDLLRNRVIRCLMVLRENAFSIGQFSSVFLEETTVELIVNQEYHKFLASQKIG